MANADFIEDGSKSYLHINGYLYVKKWKNYWNCRQKTACPATAILSANNIVKKGNSKIINLFVGTWKLHLTLALCLCIPCICIKHVYVHRTGYD